MTQKRKAADDFSSRIPINMLVSRCKIIFEDVLKLITDGELSLFTAPALNISHGETLERRSAWRSFFYPPSSPDVMKQECEAAYNIKYANVSLDKTQTAILEEICNDLLSLQLQEEMSSFRRFVVISGTADGKVDATGNLVGEPVSHLVASSRRVFITSSISTIGWSGIPFPPSGSKTRRAR